MGRRVELWRLWAYTNLARNVLTLDEVCRELQMQVLYRRTRV